MTEPAKDNGIVAPETAPDHLPDSGALPITDRAAEPNPAAPENSQAPTVKPRGPSLAMVLIIAAVVLSLSGAAAVGVSKWLLAKSAEPAAKTAAPLTAYAKGSLIHLRISPTPQTITDISFIDHDKKPLKLSDFKGQVVVLNVWATWCAPCKAEMPTLAKLQANNVGKPVKVLPLSVDTEDRFASAQTFIADHPPLDLYADQNFSAPQAYSIAGMPTTLILDKQGRQVARLDGETNWSTPEVQALIDRLVSE